MSKHTIDTTTLTISAARDHLDRGDFTAVELVEACLAVIDKRNPSLNAVLEVYDDVIEQAQKADELIAAKASLPLTGIPILLKDNILRKGQIASASSKMLQHHRAVYDSTAVELLSEHLPVFIGRTNMDEFAMGSSTEHSAYGPTKNPWDEERVPGGSSGGSAAGLAAGMALVALGSDTAGSIRQPASFCGLVGMYPTYGMVSRYGLIAMGSSLDQIGAMTRTVADMELMDSILSQYDARDAQSLTLAERQTLQKDTNKVIGVPWSFIEAEGVSEAVKTTFKHAISQLESAGYTIKDITIPDIEKSLAIYYIIMPAEVSSNLARFDGIRYGLRREGENLMETYLKSRHEGFGDETIRRIMLGTYVLSSGYYDAYYGKAQALRNHLRANVAKVFEEVDFIATPTTPTGAFKLGEKSDPLSMYMADLFTVPANIVGIPCISVPAGKDPQGLPLGIQLFAAVGNDRQLFTVAQDLETAEL